MFPHSYFPTDLRNSGGKIHRPKGKKLKEERRNRGLPEDQVLVSGFNQLWKIDQDLWRVWMSILQRTKAYLWLPLFPDVAKPNLEYYTTLYAPEVKNRIVWTPLYPQEEHLQVKALAHLQLDTHVYCGHTSGADILWAGVPTLTLPGIKQSARVGASLLRGLGLDRYLVARSFDDYGRIAARAIGQVGLKGEKDWLGITRNLLSKQKQEAPLFDVSLWVKAMESSVRMAWELEHNALPPFHVVVADL
mmetsp:Transcript_31188/g.48825  ORF Transcript_31188/g.48825 Transcript_31188/m.48825 type:complete len:247 (+) Transcript_31188:1517-2257(+)